VVRSCRRAWHRRHGQDRGGGRQRCRAADDHVSLQRLRSREDVRRSSCRSSSEAKSATAVLKSDDRRPVIGPDPNGLQAAQGRCAALKFASTPGRPTFVGPRSVGERERSPWITDRPSETSRAQAAARTIYRGPGNTGANRRRLDASRTRERRHHGRLAAPDKAGGSSGQSRLECNLGRRRGIPVSLPGHGHLTRRVDPTPRARLTRG